MLNGAYKNGVLNKVALNQLNVPVYFPNPNLGVDHGEDYQPYNLQMIKYKPKTPSVVLPKPTYYSIEQVGAEHNGNPVKYEDFPKEFYMGNPL
jgi:hypothetical protein